MSLPLNNKTDFSSTTTSQTSNNNQDSIATGNGISNLLQIDKMNIYQQRNITNHLSTWTKTKKDIIITPTQPTTTLNMHSISDNKPTNNKKIRNEPFGHTNLTKTIDSVRILFQIFNRFELSSTGHTLEETFNKIWRRITTKYFWSRRLRINKSSENILQRN